MTTVGFTGVVRVVEMMGKRAVKARPVGFDCRFIVIVDVERVDEGADFGVGEMVFAIHSPAQSMLGDYTAGEGVGRRYEFTLRGERQGEMWRYSHLEARPAK
jgi:hypothetical protein